MQGTGGAENERAVIDFLKAVSTVTRCMEFATEDKLNSLPPNIALHVEELEGLLSRLSLEAEAILARVAVRGKQ